MCSRKCAAITFLILGVPLLITGIIVAVLGSFKSLAENKIKKGLPLKAGSKSFKNWERPKGEQFVKYYVFNVTNTTIGNGGAPEIKQLGPYTYREVVFNNVTKREGNTITYVPNTKYYFDRARSCKNCDPIIDKIVTINYPLLAILKLISHTRIKNETDAIRMVGKLRYLKIFGLFQTRSVHELLWGYKDLGLTILTKKPLNQSRVYALQLNNSDSGLTKIYSGEMDVDRVTEYIEWKNLSTLTLWNSYAANAINGTSASRFKPFIDKGDDLYVMVPELCRSVKLTYDSTVKLYDIELYRYTSHKENFESGDHNPNNKGFCVTGPKKKCLPSGLLDISVCKNAKGITMVASPPLFYLGNAQLSKTFNLNPQKKLHGTFVDIEPNTGLTMQGHKRLQLNLAIQTGFSLMNILLKVTSKPIYVPVFYADKLAVISEEDAGDFEKKVLLPLRIVKVIPYVMIALGGLFLLIALIIAVLPICNRNGRKNRDIIERVPLK